MENGLWTLFFGALVGMTTLSIKEPKLYRKLAPILVYSCLLGAVCFFVFNGMVHEIYKELVPYLDKSKVDLATEKKRSLQISMLVPLCFALLWIYSIICVQISNYIESK